jgi:hypothetical protein
MPIMFSVVDTGLATIQHADACSCFACAGMEIVQRAVVSSGALPLCMLMLS